VTKCTFIYVFGAVMFLRLTLSAGSLIHGYMQCGIFFITCAYNRFVFERSEHEGQIGTK